MNKKTTDLLAILCAAIWGFGYVMSDVVLKNGFSPDHLVSIRFIIGGLVLFVIFHKSFDYADLKQVIKAGVISGSFLYLAYIGQNYGLKYTTPSKNAFLTATFVFIVPFINWVIKKERPDRYCFFGALLSIIGMALLTLENGISSINIGDILTIIGAFFLSCQILVSNEFVKKYDIRTLTVVQLLTAGLLSLIPTLVLREPITATLSGSLAMMYLTFISTIVVFMLQNYVQRIVIPARLAIFFSTEAVFGTFFSALILKEIISGKMLSGAVIILVGVLIVEVKPGILGKSRC